jgi:hypothetical protein
VSDMQVLLRKHELFSFIGKECAALVRTRWLDLVHILDFVFEARILIDSYLFIQHLKDPSSRACLSKDVFELHTTPLPLKLMLFAVESSDCTLSDIVPLVMMVQDEMRHSSPFIETTSSM